MPQTNEKAFETYVETILMEKAGWMSGDVAEWDESRLLLGVPDLPPSVTAVLAVAGTLPVEYRRPVVVATEHVELSLQSLQDKRAIGQDEDGTWLTLPGCSGEAGATGTLFLVTPAQGYRIRWWARDGEWVLPNCQIIHLLGTSGGDIDDKPYLAHDLHFLNRPKLPHGTYQTFPINELPRGSTAQRAPFAVLANPALRSTFGRHYVQVSGLSVATLEKPLRIALPMVYDEHLPAERVAIHETLLRALGIRNGEYCVLQPTNSRLDIRDRLGIFRDRQVIVRAVRSTGDVDVGYPVTRLSEEVMDLLGLVSGEHVVVMGNLRTSASRRRTRLLKLELRALLQRSEEHPASPDLRSAIGVDSLPLATMDLLRRQRLGIEHGQPVLMRPAFGSLAAAEVTVALNGLALAAAGSLVADRPAIAVASGLTFLGLLLLSFYRRFR